MITKEQIIEEIREITVHVLYSSLDDIELPGYETIALLDKWEDKSLEVEKQALQDMKNSGKVIERFREYANREVEKLTPNTP